MKMIRIVTCLLVIASVNIAVAAETETIPPNSMSQSFDELQTLLENAHTVPVIENGKAVGYAAPEQSPHSQFNKFELKSGDVIKADSPADAETLYQTQPEN